MTTAMSIVNRPLDGVAPLLEVDSALPTVSARFVFVGLASCDFIWTVRTGSRVRSGIALLGVALVRGRGFFAACRGAILERAIVILSLHFNRSLHAFRAPGLLLSCHLCSPGSALMQLLR